MYKLIEVDSYDSYEGVLAEFNNYEDCLYYYIFLKRLLMLKENSIYKINKKILY